MKNVHNNSVSIAAPVARNQARLPGAASRPVRTGHASRTSKPFNWGTAAKSIAVLAVETGIIEPVSGLCLGLLAVVMEAANGRPQRRAV